MPRINGSKRSDILNMSCLISCVIIAAVLSGCGQNEEAPAIGTDEIISEGWKEYSAGNYADAIIKYQTALEMEASNAEAHNGIAWSEARQGRIEESIDEFKKAIALDNSNVDAHAGLAGAYLAVGDYKSAIKLGKSALSLAPDYTSHHDNITSEDIRILLAECYYNTGNYPDAKAQVDLLGGTDANLNPLSPTYPADLLSVIQELSQGRRVSNIEA